MHDQPYRSTSDGKINQRLVQAGSAVSRGALIRLTSPCTSTLRDPLQVRLLHATELVMFDGPL
jgi:hypothetical protein